MTPGAPNAGDSRGAASRAAESPIDEASIAEAGATESRDAEPRSGAMRQFLARVAGWLLRPAPVAILLSVAVLLPGAFKRPQQGDEMQYVWSAGYFGSRAAHLEFTPVRGADSFLDPGWDPIAWWDLTQPMGSRLVYALAMGLSRTNPPDVPFSYALPPHETLVGPETRIPPDTLVATRLAGILCAAAGAALIAHRLAWPGVAALTIFLVLPANREILAYAWAEGPLLLGIGLCVVAYGTRLFGAACGLAATFKLTPVGWWVLLLWPGASSRRRGSLIIGLLSAVAVWVVLTPPSWYLYGPVYLWLSLDARAKETPSHVWQADGSLNLRYLWPFELAALLVLAVVVPRLAPWLRERLRRVRARTPRHTVQPPPW